MPRQQTLRGALEWSYNLLPEPEKLLFDRLSVFRGGFSLEAAEEVCAGEGLDSYDVLDVLSQLIAKSLVVVEQDSGSNARYRLLESMRLYGTERLTDTTHSESISERHASYFMALAEKSSPELISTNQAKWLDRLENDYDNFRTAIIWALDSDHVEIALRTTSALVWFWIYHRHVSDGQDLLERAVLHSENAPPTLRAIALSRAALIHAKKLEGFDRIRGWLAESLQLSDEADWSEGTMDALWTGGVVTWSKAISIAWSKTSKTSRLF